ncbi:glycosyltransferase family 4 protein [Rhodoligotrophos defluvii]|uniref:glycosyltransferase family 4 protein n=1 Tax=Rhodoligotrophos defluvii TaxID=2561934 RepID=UPI001EF07535|nr:glycosyltransferase family 1 protein [Rhodoligotrophos defluvii]
MALIRLRPPLKLLIVTDAWHPQVNGVVQTLTRTAEALRAGGHQVSMLTPEPFATFPLPSYPEIRLASPRPSAVARFIETADPDAIHIATEGVLGLLARRHCLRTGRSFTTSYHTRFPEYLAARMGHPAAGRAACRLAYAALRWFHRPSRAVMVGTPSMYDTLRAQGFRAVRLWTRGVDHALFHPNRRRALPHPGPIMLYAGRVAVEKNLDAFLSLEMPGTKYVVGDGPDLARLKIRYPTAVFTGYLHGEALAGMMASADVFVFPSRTDTFGLVLLEAMASGVPVAAFPVPGPRDIVEDGISGALDEDLGAAISRALGCSRAAARARSLEFSWERTAEIFVQLVSEAQLDKERARQIGRPSINHQPTSLGADDAGG